MSFVGVINLWRWRIPFFLCQRWRKRGHSHFLDHIKSSKKLLIIDSEKSYFEIFPDSDLVDVSYCKIFQSLTNLLFEWFNNMKYLELFECSIYPIFNLKKRKILWISNIIYISILIVQLIVTLCLIKLVTKKFRNRKVSMPADSSNILSIYRICWHLPDFLFDLFYILYLSLDQLKKYYTLCKRCFFFSIDPNI